MSGRDNLDRILLVDDDPSTLTAYERSLRSQLRNQLKLDMAQGGEEALRLLQEQGPFAVVVSDFKMPGMNGTQLLARVREDAPQTVRIMLTGEADLQSAIDAVNEGSVFRFLTKPCTTENLVATLQSGLQQHRLLRAERELLENTLGGSIKLLTDLLEMASPIAFGRASRIQQTVRILLPHFGKENAWLLDLTAMLSQVGLVAVPEDILAKIDQGAELSAEELAIWETHPKIGHDLILNIPRLEEVAKNVLYQLKQFDGTGPPAGSGPRGRTIPLGGRVLKLVVDYDALLQLGMSNEEVLAALHTRPTWYDPDIVQALQALVAQVEAGFSLRLVRIEQIEAGMVVRDGIQASKGALLVGKKQTITPSLLARLQNFARWQEIAQPLWVLVPTPQVHLIPAEPPAPSTEPPPESQPGS